MSKKIDKYSSAACAVESCRRSYRHNSFDIPALRLFKFPNGTTRKIKWMQALNLYGNVSRKFVCDRHFETKFLGKKFLIGGAVPTLNLFDGNYRFWTNHEELLLISTWESNIGDLENKGVKQMYINMQAVLSQHFNISLNDMIKKINNICKQFRYALTNQQYRDHWKPFKRIHAIMTVYQKVAKNDERSPHNGNSNDGNVSTIEDFKEFFDIKVYNESETNAYQLGTSEATESNDFIIKMEDDYDEFIDAQSCENVNDTDSTVLSAFQQIENQQNIISSELSTSTSPITKNSVNENLEKQFVPIGAVQTIDTNFGSTNYLQALQSTSAEHSEFAPNVYVCQPIPSQQNISLAATIPNSESAFNLLQAPTTCSEHAQQKSTETAEVQTIKENDEISAAVFKALTSFDEKLCQFIQTQDNLSKQIYRESQRNNLLLTKILEEEQSNTNLMEALLSRIS